MAFDRVEFSPLLARRQLEPEQLAAVRSFAVNDVGRDVRFRHRFVDVIGDGAMIGVLIEG